MNYPESVDYLYALGNEIRTAKLGLERMVLLSEAMKHPERKFRVVHVAGTNGKGSTSAMIAAGLQAAGNRVGLFTSPHLVEPTERIVIDGRAVTAPEFSEAFDAVHRVADRMMEAVGKMMQVINGVTHQFVVRVLAGVKGLHLAFKKIKQSRKTQVLTVPKCDRIVHISLLAAARRPANRSCQ